MRPQSAGAVLAIATVLLAGCTTTRMPQVSAARTPGATDSAASTLTDREAIYVEVLRHYLGHDAIGGRTSWAGAYVLDRAADPTHRSTDALAITPAEQQAITTTLAATVKITFISDSASVLDHPDSCPYVHGDAILITLGTQVRTGSNRHVGITGFGSCKAATSLTYLVEPSGGWHVTGTTGAMAIA